MWLHKDKKRLEELIKRGECKWDDKPSHIREQHPEFAKYNIQQFTYKWNYIKRGILQLKSMLEHVVLHGYTFLYL